MTDRIVLEIDWQSVALAFGAVVAIIFGAFVLWEVLSFLFGTTIGRFVLGVGLLAVVLWVIFEVDDD